MGWCQSRSRHDLSLVIVKTKIDPRWLWENVAGHQEFGEQFEEGWAL